MFQTHDLGSPVARPNLWEGFGAANMGGWVDWDPVKRRGCHGVFYPDSWLAARKIRDGMSKMLAFAEVKAYTPYERNAAAGDDLLVPASAEDLPAGGDQKFDPPIEKNTGHTESVDGRVHQTGLTTTFTPNSNIIPGRVGVGNIDWTNQQEGKSDTGRTYAAVTARSHHAGLINTVLLDGSVRAVPDDIDLKVWRAYSTRASRDRVDYDN